MQYCVAQYYIRAKRKRHTFIKILTIKISGSFNLHDTINTTIIVHYPVTVGCGTKAFGSVSIVKTEANDTIRILNLCNMEHYKPGQKVVFKPAEKPNFSVHFSQTTVQYENKDTLYEQSSAYDLKILKTAWGYAVE